MDHRPERLPVGWMLDAEDVLASLRAPVLDVVPPRGHPARLAVLGAAMRPENCGQGVQGEIEAVVTCIELLAHLLHPCRIETVRVDGVE